MDDKEYYLRAEKEYNSSNLDKATLAKANTLIKGDENQIKYKYIELRAEYLKKEALISTAKKYGKTGAKISGGIAAFFFVLIALFMLFYVLPNL